MNRGLAAWVVSLGLLLAVAAPLVAQPPYGYPVGRTNFGPYRQPALSPYLNLLRGGSPSANYFLGVVPEFQRRANDIRFSSAIDDLEQRANVNVEEEDLLPTLPGTGHPVAFNNLGTYFGAVPTPRQAPVSLPPPRTGRTR